MPTVNTLVLTEFSDSENSRTWTLADHNVSEPRLVIQKRKVPNSNQTNAMSETSIKLVCGLLDADSLPIPQKASIEAIIRYPVGTDSSELSTLVDRFQLVVASTNFDTVVTTQGYLG